MGGLKAISRDELRITEDQFPSRTPDQSFDIAGVASSILATPTIFLFTAA
jgi:hypothetical protein